MGKKTNRKIAAKIRSRLHDAMENDYKTGYAVENLGCTIEFLKEYLEGKFTLGMTWENRSEWHVDHIVPLSSFDLTNDEELKEACHYTNLQPMWAKDNLKKNDRYMKFVKTISVPVVKK